MEQKFYNLSLKSQEATNLPIGAQKNFASWMLKCWLLSVASLPLKAITIPRVSSLFGFWPLWKRKYVWHLNKMQFSPLKRIMRQVCACELKSLRRPFLEVSSSVESESKSEHIVNTARNIIRNKDKGFVHRDGSGWN